MKTWTTAKKILCIRLDTIGDVLMMTPAIRALRESAQGRKITLLTSSRGATITPLIPEIDNTITFDVPWERVDKITNTKDFFSLIEAIKKETFDAAVCFGSFSQNQFPAACIAYLAGIPLRVGYSRENPFHLLTDYLPDTEPFTPVHHEVIRQLQLVAHIGAQTSNDSLSLKISEAAGLTAKNILQKKGVTLQKPFIILHPGVSDPKRQYPKELYAKAANLIVTELGYQIVLTGIKEEQSITNFIAEKVRRNIFSCAGDFSLEQLIALITLSDLLITNDSAPSHIAAAVGKKVVVLYARTNPMHTPWKANSRVLYFDVAKELQTKNPLLAYSLPKREYPTPLPEEIFMAVKELLYNKKQTHIRKDILTWANTSE